MAKGGGMKGTKYKAMGGGMKSTKGFAKGGAALRCEMKANPGMGNLPKSVMSALRGGGTRAQGQANVLKGTKGMAMGGGMRKNTKGMAKGGGMKKGTKYRAKGGMMSNLSKGIKNIDK